MGDHLETVLVTPVDDDPRLGITDLYAFPSPANPDTSVLVLCVSPVDPPAGSGFHPKGIYQVNVDTNGDAVADLAYNITFRPADAGLQIADVRRATGETASGAPCLRRPFGRRSRPSTPCTDDNRPQTVARRAPWRT